MIKTELNPSRIFPISVDGNSIFPGAEAKISGAVLDASLFSHIPWPVCPPIPPPSALKYLQSPTTSHDLLCGHPSPAITTAHQIQQPPPGPLSSPWFPTVCSQHRTQRVLIKSKITSPVPPLLLFLPGPFHLTHTGSQSPGRGV